MRKDIFSHFLYELVRPRLWPFIAWARHQLHKLRDYDRVSHDYSVILNHTSLGELDDTAADVYDALEVIEMSQMSFYHDVMRSDLEDILDHPYTDLDHVREYAQKL